MKEVLTVGNQLLVPLSQNKFINSWTIRDSNPEPFD